MARESIRRLCRKSQDICSGMKKLGKIRYEFGTGIAVGGLRRKPVWSVDDRNGEKAGKGSK